MTILQPQSTSGGYWANVYFHHLLARLDDAIEKARQLDPPEILTHFRSYLALIQQAHAYPQLAIPLCNLIVALRYWPLRWGYGDTWESELRFAAKILQEERRDLDLIRVWISLSQLLLATTRFDEAIQLSEQTAALAQRNGAYHRMMEAVTIQITAMRSSGKNEQASQVVARFEALLNVLPAEDISYEILLAYARLQLLRMTLFRREGQFKQAIEQANSVVDILLQIEPLELILLADAYRSRANMLWGRSQYPEAADDLRRAVKLYRQAGDVNLMAMALGNLGVVLSGMACYRQALESFEESIHLSEKYNSRFLMICDVGNLAQVYYQMGDLSTASKYVGSQMGMAKNLSYDWEINRALISMGGIWVARGKLELAREYLEEGLAYFRREGQPEIYASDSLMLAHCLIGSGELERAGQIIADALRVAEETDSPAVKAIALRYQADLVPLPEKRNLLQHSLEIARRCHRRLDEAAVLFMLCACETNVAERRRLWETGSEVLREIEAEQWLENASEANPPVIPLVI